MFTVGDNWGKYTITGTKTIIHGPLFPNRNIVQEIALQGRRGAQATAYVARDGKVGTLRRDFGYFEGEQILDAR